MTMVEGNDALHHPERIMSSTSKLAKFDPAVGSTVNTGLDEKEDGVFVPDVTEYMKQTAFIAIMTPMGNPLDENCIWGAPVCYWGLPATAKSDRIEQAANEANLGYQTIYPGQHQPEDFSGALVPSPVGYTIECMLSAVRTLNSIGKGVIFLDEINNATRATEGAMLGFIQKRRVGDVAIAPGIRLLAAANPPRWSVNGFKMAPPTANRFCHLQVKCPSVESWSKFMVSEETKVQFDAKMTEETIRARWGSVYGYVKSLVIGYIHSQPLALHHEPSPDSEQSGFCWGSPRSWTLAARMMATSRILGYPEEITTLILEGCVGQGLGFEFLTWMRNSDLPTPEEVLSKGWKPDPLRLDVAWAVLASVTQYVVTIPNLNDRIGAACGAWSLYGEFVKANMGDMCVSAAQTLVNKGLSRKHHPIIKNYADPVIRWMIDTKLLAYVETV